MLNVRLIYDYINDVIWDGEFLNSCEIIICLCVYDRSTDFTISYAMSPAS